MFSMHSSFILDKIGQNRTGALSEIQDGVQDGIQNYICNISACRWLRNMILASSLMFWGHFSIAPGPIHKKQSRDFDLTQPHDTVTSWRHSMTHPNLFSLSQLVDVLERWFFFCFYETLGCWVRKCQFCICMMTSRHDVMSWRQKQAVFYLSL